MLSKIFLEISSACDMACSFCPPTRRPATFMSEEDFRLALDRIGSAGKQLFFHVKGEPTIHPRFGDFLRLAGERGYTLSLTTNGRHLGRWAEALLEEGKLVKVSVSLHGQAELPERRAYWEGLDRFLALRRERRPSLPTSLRLWCLDSGCLPPETESLWEELQARWPELGPFKPAETQPPSRRLETGVFLNPAERFEWPGPASEDREDTASPDGGPRGAEWSGGSKPGHGGHPEHGTGRGDSSDCRGSSGFCRGFCRGLENQAGILVDGTVVPCCLDGEGLMPLGNLFETPLEEILEGHRARAIREGFKARRVVEPVCRACGYRLRFKR